MTAARERLASVLYVYNPCHGEDATVDDLLEIDALVPVSSDDTLVILFRPTDDSRNVQVELPFRKQLRLGDILPKSLQPGPSRPRQRVRINLSIGAGRQSFHSQPQYELNLVESKTSEPTDRERCTCSLPWRYLRLGHLFATPCYSTVEGFRVPSHVRTDYSPWNGETMVRLRESLVSGCPKYCKTACPHYGVQELEGFVGSEPIDGLILNNSQRAMQQYRDGDVRLTCKPTVLAITMGTNCNYHCRFCSTHASSAPFAIGGRTLELAKECFPHARRVFFTGGEPLIYKKELDYIIGPHRHQKGKWIKFMTNGILLAKSVELLSGFDKLKLSINLNTASERIYHQIHGTNGLGKVLDGIEKVREARAGRVTDIELKSIVMRTTYKGLDDFSQLACNVGAKSVVFSDLRWNCSQAIGPEEQLRPGDPERRSAEAVVDEAEAMLIQHGIRVTRSFTSAEPH